MLFPTFTFVFFLIVVVVLRWASPRRLVLPILLAASYVFYLSWGPIYGILLAGSTVFTWFVAARIAAATSRGARRLWLALGVSVALGTLAVFKYGVFAVTQTHALLEVLGVDWDAPVVRIVLPLGVSFFLFQMISYVVDVYRGHAPERSLFRYALYITFFPQLVAGPIVRADELLPQLHAAGDETPPPPFIPERFAGGVDLLLRGFIKKVVIADNLAQWSDAVFKDPLTAGSWGAVLGVLCYAGQIYGDFSGYTDMARGAGKMLGFELPDNFALPYLASSITEFWRRWHMTLSRWLRDYLYIPLGGNRKGPVRRDVNLMITMGLGGLWHGANWTFLVWGVYHGALLMLHKGWSSLRPARLTGLLPYRALTVVVTFALVCLGWIVFRAQSLEQAGDVIGAMFAGAPGPEVLPKDASHAIWFLGALAVGHALGATHAPKRVWAALPAPARGLAWGGAILACYVFAGRPADFIYFAF
ncbi:MAG: MBOAT family protein [Deltaproteobacteria bacterium]|nr:MBOAT family protein [Deltaproteobacteria bacterium]